MRRPAARSSATDGARIDAGLQRLERQLVRLLGIERKEQRTGKLENGAKHRSRLCIPQCRRCSRATRSTLALRAEHKRRRRQARCLVACANDSCSQLRLQTLRAAANQRERRMHAVHRPDHARSGSCSPIRFLIEAPPYQRSFAWTRGGSRPAAGRHRLGARAEAESRPGGDYFLGTMLFIERGRSAVRASRRWPLRRRQRALEVVDGLQRLTTLTILFCVLRDLDDGDGQPPNAAPAGGDQRRARARTRATGCRCGSPKRPSSSATCARRAPPARCPRRRPLAGRGAHPGGARPLRRGARRTTMPPSAAQLADFLLDRCCVVHGGDDRHRPRPPHVHGAQHHGQAARRATTSSRPSCSAACRPPQQMRGATAIWDAGREACSARTSRACSATSAPCTGVPATGDLRHQARSPTRRAGRRPSSSACCSPPARIFDDIRNARHSGSPQSAAIAASLRYLGWHSSSDWIPPAHAVVAREGQGRGRARVVPRPGSIGWPTACASWGSAAPSARAALRRRGRAPSATAADLEGARQPAQSAREELRTIHHNLRDLHARSAPVAKLVLLRLNDADGRRAAVLALPSEITVEHVLPRKPGTNSPWRELASRPGRARAVHGVARQPRAGDQGAERQGRQPRLRPQAGGLVQHAGAPVPCPSTSTCAARRNGSRREIKAREAELLRLLEQLWQLRLMRQPREPPRSATRRKPGAGAGARKSRERARRRYVGVLRTRCAERSALPLACSGRRRLGRHRGMAVPIMQSRVTMAASSLLAPALGALGPHRQHDVAQVGGGIVHAHLHALRQLDAELGQHAARIDDGARAVGEALVPGRRNAEQHLGVAGAQRADDDVVHLWPCSRPCGTRRACRCRCRARHSAARVSLSSRFLKAGSVQARATTLAPSAGERLSIRSTWRRSPAAVSTPFSISSARTASSSTS